MIYVDFVTSKSWVTRELDLYYFSNPGEKVTVGQQTMINGVVNCHLWVGSKYVENHEKLQFVVAPYENHQMKDVSHKMKWVALNEI